MGIRSTIAALLVLCMVAILFPFQATCFAPATFFHRGTMTVTRTIDLPFNTVSDSYATSVTTTTTALAAVKDDGTNNDSLGIQINPTYAIAYVLFLSFAFLQSSNEPDGGASMEVLQKFLSNPQHPEGINELFVLVFNLLGLIAAPIACLLLPGARSSKLPATPFILGSLFGGYGALGIYASTRSPDSRPVSKADLGWVTANILENKILNYVIVVACISAIVTSGALEALISDPTELLRGYSDMLGTAIASVSSLDLFILTLSAASFIPEDLERRSYDGKFSPQVIAASTILLPVLGVALYCALRPALEEE